MSPEDILPSLVELSIAVAGFSGVVVALRPMRPSGWSETSRGLFAVLLTSTLLSAGVCVFAMVVRAAPVAEPSAWAVVSAAHVAVLVGIISLRVWQYLRTTARRTPPPAVGALLTLNALIIGAQLLNAAHYRSGWLCLTGLSLYAFFGFFVFVLLVTELWTGAPDGS